MKFDHISNNGLGDINNGEGILQGDEMSILTQAVYHY